MLSFIARWLVWGAALFLLLSLFQTAAGASPGEPPCPGKAPTSRPTPPPPPPPPPSPPPAIPKAPPAPPDVPPPEHVLTPRFETVPEEKADKPAEEEKLRTRERLKSDISLPIPNPAEYGGPAGKTAVVFQAGGEVTYDPRRRVKKGKLKFDEELLTAAGPHPVQKVIFQGGEYVELDRFGYVKRGTLKNNTKLHTPLQTEEQKVELKAGTEVRFDRNGNVYAGTLGGDQSLVIGFTPQEDKKAAFADGTKITFDPKTGAVKDGFLKNSGTFTYTPKEGGGQSVTLKPGTWASFDRGGNVTDYYPK